LGAWRDDEERVALLYDKEHILAKEDEAEPRALNLECALAVWDLDYR